MSSNKTIIFTHIPKVAGTSLQRRLIDENYAPEEMRKFQGIRDLLANRKAPFRILIGHNPYGMSDFLPGQARYFTMLRNPVERVLSHYFFIKQPETNPHRVHNPAQRAVHRSTPLKEIFDKTALKRYRPATSWLVDNMQTRYTAGYRYTWRPKSSSALLAEAKRRLRDDYAVFGVQEHFEQSVTVVADCFGWTVGAPSEKKSQPTRVEKVYDDEDLAAVKANNALDQELWEYATELFKTRYL